ncbi:hypothetical protein PMZ80_001529 [Knufia obscura]|uniref:Uncharacterized protein n=2 Tax=Knufia TaxID=430999 RepID=A0AAN8EPH6_9EURO|nr:hypothetical protein PMZ80_001529 [Knufia obscura]KAK5955647.1 hypothetical protein OHC33_003288 [Knufia fluminis]
MAQSNSEERSHTHEGHSSATNDQHHDTHVPAAETIPASPTTSQHQVIDHSQSQTLHHINEAQSRIDAAGVAVTRADAAEKAASAELSRLRTADEEGQEGYAWDVVRKGLDALEEARRASEEAKSGLREAQEMLSGVMRDTLDRSQQRREALQREVDRVNELVGRLKDENDRDDTRGSSVDGI